MFSVNNVPTVLLFNSGASHSFILRSFVAQNKFPFSLLGKNMLVQSPGSLIRSNLVYRNLEININGACFPTSLIIIESVKLDIILGMNWFTQYQLCINCATQEELPGMLPNREFELAIDLVPETAPLYKKYYRMPSSELVELKK